MGKKYKADKISIGGHTLDADRMVILDSVIEGGAHSEAGYISSFTDTNTQLTDAEIAAMGYIKTYTDTNTNTQLTSAQIAAMGYLSTATGLEVFRSEKNIDDPGTYMFAQDDGGWTGGARLAGAHNGYGVISMHLHADDYYGQIHLSAQTGDMGIRFQNASSTWGSIYTVHTSKHFSTADVANGKTAHGWGNHASAGYLTSYTDTNTQLSQAQVGAYAVDEGFIKTYTDTNTQLTSAQIAEMGYTSNTGTVTTVGVTAGVGISVSIANRTTEPQITLTNTGYYFQGANTGYVGSGGMQNWNSQESTPNLNPNTNWFTSLRIGHGHPVDYYSNTLGIQMTGSDSGRIYTRNIAGGTAGSWKKYYHTGDFSTADVAKGVTAHGWSNHADAGYLTSYTDTNTQLTPAQVLTSIKAVDGSGSGLDADTVDGSHANLSYGAGKQYDFTINGDADTFYPVVIHGASNARMTRLTIFRGYSETAPSTWNTASHKGGLTLDMDVRFGGWGGYPNMMNVHDFGEIYSRICGGAAWTAHTMKFVVWLRGGGASYHIDSPSTNLSIEVNDSTSAENYVSTNTWYSYDHPTAAYDRTVVAKNLTEADTGANALLAYMPIRSNGNQNKAISGVDGLGYISSTGSMRAPYFYDLNDTSYYLDPASSSNLFSVTAQHFYGNITGNASTATTATTATKATNLYGLGYIQSTSSGTSYGNNYQVRENYGGGSNTAIEGAPTLSFHWSGVVASSIMMQASGRIGIYNNPGTGYDDFIASTITASSSHRAPIFYDSNDTNYYLNPAGTSTLNVINATGGTSTEWNAAHGWGNHADAGYTGDQDLSGYFPISGGSLTGSANITGATADFTTVSSWNLAAKAGDGNGYSFWGTGTSYKISMGNSSIYHYGDVPGYSIKTQMDSGSTDRGFTWGRVGAVPIASLNSTSGIFTTEGAIKAPVFYDSNDTGYYLNPSATSNLNIVQAVQFQGSLAGTASNANTLDGFSSESFLRSDADDTVNAGVTYTWTRTDTAGLIFTNNSYNTKLYMGGWTTTNSNNISRIRTSNGNLHIDSAANGNTYLNWYSGGDVKTNSLLQSDASLRAPIFYDSNNTSYYVDAGSTTQLNHLKVNSTFGSRTLTAGSTGYVLENRGTGGATFRFDGDSFIFYGGGGVGNVFEMNQDGNSTGRTSLRAPIFYDSNDTGYYLNPASTSRLNEIQTSDSGAAPRYDTAFYVIQGQHWYGDTGSQVMYIGESGSPVRLRGNLRIGGNANADSGMKLTVDGSSNATSSFRAPIFYDTNNTGYYLNPASTSNLNALTLAGTATASNFILSSDERKKTKIKDLPRNNINTNWKSFEMKNDEGEYRTGVIAQELEETHPEFVNTDPEGFKSVKYIDLLIAKIAELEARLEKLEK